MSRLVLTTALMALALIANAFPTAAQDVPLARPAVCAPVLTVQFRGCQVTNYLICDGAAGTYHREETTEADRPTDVEHSTEDGLLIGIAYGDQETALLGILDGADRTAIDVLGETGRGEWRQDGLLRLFGNFTRPISMQMTAQANGTRHLGILEQFDLQGFLKMPPPMDLIQISGKGYFHPDLSILIEGETTLSWSPGDAGSIPHKPARLIHAGEAGFDTATPKYDCNHLSLLSPQTARRHS